MGSPIANRNRAEIEPLIGFFVNTLALRTDLSGNPCFGRLLDRVRDTAVDAYAHQDLPFEKLVDELGLERNTGHTPLFQVLMVLQNMPMEAGVMDTVTVKPIEGDAVSAKTDLSFMISEAGDGVMGRLVYNVDLFTPETAQRLADHYVRLLTAAVEDPARNVFALPLTTPAETETMLHRWNDTAISHDRGDSIPARFAAVVAEHGEAEALVWGDPDAPQVMTYTQLSARAASIAHRLINLGLRPGDPVGVYLDRSMDVVPALLGITMAGGAYLPLDIAYPTERLALMLDDARPALLITQSGLDDLTGAGVTRLHLDMEDLDPLHAEPPAVPTGGDALAYVIYTSGSTGRPKGVMATHRAVVDLVSGDEMLKTSGAVLQLSSVSFDAATFEIWGPLLNGGRCILYPERVPTLAALRAVFAAHPIDHVFLTTALFNLLVDEDPVILAHVRGLLTGGEAFSADHGRRAVQALPHAQLVNIYGPTETTTFACGSPLGHDPGQLHNPVPIGRPYRNTRLYVADDLGQAMPVGFPGELLIGGTGLARGYFNSPRLTADRFRPDPFGTRPGERVYRTGDLVRYAPDGQIVFMGRFDDQIKLRGFRIELGEIETALAADPKVDQVKVVLRTDSGVKRLAAYIVGPEADELELHAELARKLPDYMVPAAFITLDAMPLSPNGKIDTKRLPAPEKTGARQGFQPPQNEREVVLAVIWQRLLGVPRVGLQDNFFELGGDSILSIQVIARAREEGLSLSTRDIFENQTLSALAAVAREDGGLMVDQGPVTGAHTLAPVQHWFLQADQPDAHHFNQSLMFSMEGKVDETALRNAGAALIDHHDALRLRFKDGAARYAPTGEPTPFETWTLPAADEGAWADAVADAAAKVQASLNLEHGPLLRLALFRPEPGGAVTRSNLLLVIHHLVVDGVSWRILLDQFQTALTAASQNQPVQLPAKTSAYRDWTARLATMAQDPLLKEQVHDWLESLPQNWQPQPVPRTAEGENTGGNTHRVSVNLNPRTTDALLRRVPRAFNTRIDDVLLTALLRAWRQWSGQQTLWLDLEGHGRDDLFNGELDLSRTVGWFTAVYPVLLSGDGALTGDLKFVKEHLRNIPLNGQGFGIVRYLTDGERLRGLPQPEVSFNYLGQTGGVVAEDGPLGPAAESMGPAVAPTTRRAHLIDVSGIVMNDSLQLGFTYARGIHEEADIQALADAVLAALEDLIGFCTRKDVRGYTPSDFPLTALEQDTLDRIIAGRTDVADLYPLSPMQSGMLFHGLYNPDDTYFEQLALSFEGDFDTARFRQAWAQVVRRQGVLRTCFHWEGLKTPLQLVSEEAVLNWTEEDWRDRDPQQQQRDLVAFRQVDRNRPFDLNRAPPARWHLFRLSEETVHFVFSYHHLLLDGWSMPLLMREVFACYDGTRQLPPAPAYRDYIAWIQRHEPGAAAQYWREALSDVVEVTPLPLGAVVDNAEPAHWEDRLIHLSEEVSNALQQRARDLRTTPNILGQAAWGLLLQHTTGSDDVVFGTTVSGRPAAQTQTIGLFINTLPVRIQGAGGDEWLQALHAEQVRRDEFSWCPLVEVPGYSGVPGGVNLFDTLFVFENYPVESVAEEGGEARVVLSRVESFGHTNFPLTLVVAPGARMSLKLIYDTRAYRAEQAETLLAMMTRLLKGIAGGEPAHHITVLNDAQREAVLADFNRTDQDFGPWQPLQHAFEKQAARTPQATALVFRGETLSYAQLDQRANQLARYLRGQGVGPDVPVGVCLHRSPELVTALYAVLKAGGAYLPLDPDHPADRLNFTLADAAAPLVLTTPDLQDKLDGVRYLDVTQTFAEPVHRPEVNLAPDNLAYIIYTSGSTGKPKGAMNSHRAITNRIHWMQDAYRLDAQDAVLQKTPFSFDVSVWEFFWPLMHGARLVIAEPGLHGDPAYLAGLIREQGITTLHFVPSMLAAFLEEAAVTRCKPRQIFASGEALSPALVNRCFQALPDTALHNLYGPTEAAVDVSRQACTPGMDRVPIGKPAANTCLYVLNPRLQPMLAGVPGELFIGGVQPARGYLNRPALTAATFLPNPYGEPGARMYRTGDRAVLENENLYYLGRVDFQVKLRGFRIELGEIESALAENGAPRNAVLVRGDILAAYISGSAPDEETLRRALQARLPDYMVPNIFLYLSELPVTANGKLDRRALPEPGAPVETMTAPETDTEQALADIWREVLGIDAVGRESHFFRLGGHSLSATRLVSQIRERLAVELPLKTVFDAPTLAAMASAVGEGVGVLLPPVRVFAPAERDLPPNLPRDGADYYPLSFAQQRLWFLDRLDPGSAGYNMPAALRLTGPLDHAALEEALNRVIARQGSLRTTFPAFGDMPVQRVAPHKRITLPVEPVEPAAVEAVAAAEAATPFDPATGPLLRVRLLQVVADDHILLITQHHIISDGWSQGIFAAELAAAFGQEKGEISELRVSYGDYAVWQRRYLAGAVLQRQLDWWINRLADAPTVITLPTDRPRPARCSFRGGRIGFQLPDPLTADLDALARAHGVTRFMLLQAAFAVLLSRFGAGDDLLIGSPAANRDRAEIEPLIGFFVNTLVMRHQLHGDPAFDLFLAQTRDNVLDAFAHGDAPFEQLVEALHPERARNHHPLCQVIFNLQEGAAGAALQLDQLTLAPMDSMDAGTRFDLNLTMRSAGDALGGDLTYDRDLFDAAAAERLLAAFIHLLTQIAADPTRRTSQLPLVDQVAWLQRVATWNRTAGPRPPGQTLHGLFAASVAAHAGAVAIQDPRESITYAQLDAQSNGLAHALIARGVRPGDRVAIGVARARDMITAQLAVLKTGAAYVPLQLDQPGARLAAILTESGARVLIHRGGETTFPDFKGQCLDLTDAPAPVDHGPEAAVDDRLPAYLIYTSGSTGRPKGVAVPHRAIVNRLLYSQTVWPLDGKDALVPVGGFGFDASVWELHGTLMAGARLFSPDQPLKGDTAQLVDLITRYHLTALFFVPTLLEAFLAEPGAAGCAEDLRLLISGGEVLTDATAGRCTDLLGVALVNIYGPTEAAVSVTEWSTREPGDRVTLGTPLANVEIFILDAEGGLAAPGAMGEVCIGGTCLANGYHNRPARTAAVFVPHPFSAEPGARLYRTGDLGRYLMRPDGSIGQLVYLGRADGQVKIRGQRVELGEIEAALRKLEGVQRAVAGLHDGLLIAWLVGMPADPAARRAELAGLLPQAMIPQRFINLETLPMTPNGKLDRRALKRLVDEQPGEEAPAEPVGPLEAGLHTIWKEELENNSLGVTTNFFEAGGHSLPAVKLMARIRRELGVDLPLTALFEAPTIRDMADLLRQEPSRQTPLVPIHPVGEGRPFFCVHPGGGNVLCYRDLANLTNRPFYGLQSPGLYGGDQPETIETMAALYVEAVKSVQSEGPYDVGGWSMGGPVAYEMARQLRANGDKVGVMAVFDAHMQAPDKPVQPLDEDTAFVNLLNEVARDQKITLPVDPKQLLTLPAGDRLPRVIQALEDAGLLGEDFDAGRLTRIWTAFRANMNALTTYRPKPYGGKITYFRSEEDFGPEDPVTVWLNQAEGGLVLRPVPGNHDTMIDQPHVRTLARMLNHALR
ncbi:MAG: amino acid adenylation domain-containing protein [Acidobacteriota bacterium]|nr:amino acid adenylation domain-containing protein [Acidobacteriota bacterium]